MMNRTQHLLLDILANSLFQKPLPNVADIDWKGLLTEAEQQAVYPLIYVAIKSELERGVSAEVFKKYEELFFSYIYKAVNNLNDHKEIHDILKVHSIPYVIIKGQASAMYYQNPGLRVAGDVDLLVDKRNLEKVGQLLEERGCRRTTDTEHGFHVAYYAGISVFEVHWRPNGVPSGEKGVLCKKYLKDIIRTSYEYNGMQMPRVFEHCLVILLHTVSHMINAGIGLRHLCDWAVYIEKVDVSSYEKELRDIGLWRFAQLLTQVVIEYLGAPMQPWAFEQYDEKLLDAMMADILAAGDFGIKDKERINEAKFMTTRAKMNVKDSGTIKHICGMMSENARLAMPICKKYPVLLPIGWIYAGSRYVYLMCKGKRPSIHIKKVMDNVKTRTEIYKRFNLYE